MAAGTMNGVEQAPATPVKDVVVVGTPGTGGIADTMLENGVLAVSESKKAREAERRRRRRKQKKKGKGPGTANSGGDEDTQSEAEDAPKPAVDKFEVEYVSEKPDFVDEPGDLNPEAQQDFLRVFEKFSVAEEMFPTISKEDGLKDDDTLAQDSKKSYLTNDDDEDEQDVKSKAKAPSNKQKKLQRRMKIAELKQQCLKPDVVEVWDATAADPRLLVFLKAYRNTVPVPRHWCQKRKFLQGAAHRHL